MASLDAKGSAWTATLIPGYDVLYLGRLRGGGGGRSSLVTCSQVPDVRWSNRIHVAHLTPRPLNSVRKGAKRRRQMRRGEAEGWARRDGGNARNRKRHFLSWPSPCRVCLLSATLIAYSVSTAILSSHALSLPPHPSILGGHTRLAVEADRAGVPHRSAVRPSASRFYRRRILRSLRLGGLADCT